MSVRTIHLRQDEILRIILDEEVVVAVGLENAGTDDEDPLIGKPSHTGRRTVSYDYTATRVLDQRINDESSKRCLKPRRQA